MSALTFHAPFPIDRTITRDGIAVLTGAGLAALVAERMKQVDVYGRTLAADQRNELLDLALAGISYANTGTDQLAGLTVTADSMVEPTYPWPADGWKPEATARENLVKAAALLWAAIDYLDHRPTGKAVDLEHAA